MGIKKGKRTPYQTEALLPVIFSNVIVVATYPAKARLTLNNRGFSSSLDPPRSLKKARLPLIKPSKYRLVFTLYPVKRFISSPQPAGTTACGH